MNLCSRGTCDCCSHYKIKESNLLKDILKKAKICIPDHNGNLHVWFGGVGVTIIDPDTGQDIDYFFVSPWSAAKPSLNNVIKYIRNRINNNGEKDEHL